MIKYWSYIDEYKKYRLKILNSIDRVLKSGNLFFLEKNSRNLKKIYKNKQIKLRSSSW